MSTVPKLRFTPEEYLVRERAAPTKSEYYQGEIFATTGASRAHNLIVNNFDSIVAHLFGAFAQKILARDTLRKPKIVLHLGLPLSHRLSVVDHQGVALRSSEIDGSREACNPPSDNDYFPGTI